MLYKDYKVKRPKGTKLQKGYVYHVLEVKWNKDKKYATDKRINIGKMIDDEYMIPNDSYRLYYPDDSFELGEPPLFNDTLKIGSTLLIRKLLESSELDNLINTIHSDYYADIINLICYIVINETTKFQYYPYFSKDHSIIGSCIRSDSYISKLLKDISEKDIDLFIKAWNSVNSDIKDIYINYDSTNMNTSAKGIALAEYGHPKIDEGLPQVNISYATSAIDSKPLFYEVYPGSIIDNSQFSYMLNKASEYGYKKIGFILDRGYYSQSNINYLDRNKYDFIMMIKNSNPLLKKEYLGFEDDIDYFIDNHNVFGKTIKAKLNENDKKTRFFNIYYSDDLKLSDKYDITSKVKLYTDELDEIISSKKLVTKDGLSKYEEFFKLSYDTNGYFKSYKLNSKAVNDCLSKCGYFMIISSKNLGAKKVLDIYRNRDSVEKIFRALKSSLDYEHFRVYSDSSLKAKTHITFIASIIRNEIHQKLLPLYEENRKTYTVTNCLYELDNITASLNSRDIYIRKYGLTAKQKKILKQFKLNEKDVDLEIQRINKSLNRI